MFKKGEYVVHGRSGVCVVDGTTKEVPGSSGNQLYYELVPVKTPHSKIFFPVDNDRVVLRAMLTKAEAEDMLKEMKKAEPVHIANDRERENEFKKSIASCDCVKIATVIKTLIERSQEREEQGKRSTFVDARLLNDATDLINNEFSLALGIDMCDIEDYVLKEIM